MTWRSSVPVVARAAAIHATGLGKNVVMVERGTGGTCVNTGCVTGTTKDPVLQVVGADGATEIIEARHYHLPRVVFTTPNIAAVGGPPSRPPRPGSAATPGVLPLENVPRALVNRDTRGFGKVVANADTGKIVGVTRCRPARRRAGRRRGLHPERGYDRRAVAELWCPYLTMTEGIKIACQSFTTDVSKLSCCAS